MEGVKRLGRPSAPAGYPKVEGDTGVSKCREDRDDPRRIGSHSVARPSLFQATHWPWPLSGGVCESMSAARCAAVLAGQGGRGRTRSVAEARLVKGVSCIEEVCIGENENQKRVPMGIMGSRKGLRDPTPLLCGRTRLVKGRGGCDCGLPMSRASHRSRFLSLADMMGDGRVCVTPASPSAQEQRLASRSAVPSVQPVHGDTGVVLVVKSRFT